MNKRFYFNKLSSPVSLMGKGMGSGHSGTGAAGVAALTLQNAVNEVENPDLQSVHLGEKLDISLPGEIFLHCKRAFDVIISCAALLVFALILPLLAIIIKVDSPGPIFYSQDRVGINRRRKSRRQGDRSGSDRRRVLQPGSPFRVHKLRTMGVNAEAGGPQWASQNDVRVTRVGRFLRKTRLDEVPQFWNVLKGEMSLVGPRPERLVFVRQLEKDIPEYHDRLLVLPGITGLAQVINGYDDSLDSVRRKVELDRQYIRSAGFVQEGRILFNTVGVVLKGEGAR
jgi:lipopolysaccharide/colanic/teichoic acid biosynthesis glycosyltransferase